MNTADTPEWHAYYDALLPFLKEFEQESDRASVILGSARLDHALRVLLQRALLPTAKEPDPLLAWISTDASLPNIRGAERCSGGQA